MYGGLQNPNRLIVEGITDRQAVLGLIEAHTDWPSQQMDGDRVPVYIECGKGVKKILNKKSVELTMKTDTIRNLGLIVDANSDVNARFTSLRNCFLPWFPGIPRRLPRGGFIVEDPNGRRLGAWIMPNNISGGTLEDLLIELVPEMRLFNLVSEFVDSISTETRIQHKNRSKTLTYAWLSVQDPPVQDLRTAFARGYLDPTHPKAALFVDWMLKLYGMPRRV